MVEQGILSFETVGTGDIRTNINSTITRDAAITSVKLNGTTYQAAAWWNETGTLTIAKRIYPGGAWAVQVYAGGSVPHIIVFADNHETVDIGFDPNGYLHIAYGHHVSPLTYRKSTAPIDTWDFQITGLLPMLGTNETQVTYPTLFNDPAGNLYIVFRDGIGTNGDMYFYKYDHASALWAATTGSDSGGRILSYKASAGPYWDLPVFDANFGAGGFMHLSWVLRTSNESYNAGYYYAKWDGAAWHDYPGNGITAPISPANAYRFLNIPTLSGLANVNSIAVNSSGIPHVAYVKNDAQKYAQYFVAYPSAGTWHEVQITHDPTVPWDEGIDAPGGGLYTTIARPRILITAANEIRVIGLNNTTPQGVHWWKSNNYLTWIRESLYGGRVEQFEPNYDPYQWRVNGKLEMLIAPWWDSIPTQSIIYAHE